MADNTDNERNKENRSRERVQVKENTLVYNNKTFAEIIDISESGLSCRYLANLQDDTGAITSVDLLNSEEKLHVKDIDCIEVQNRDEIISYAFPFTVRRVSGIKFASLDKTKLQQLRDFILKSQVESDS